MFDKDKFKPVKVTYVGGMLVEMFGHNQLKEAYRMGLHDAMLQCEKRANSEASCYSVTMVCYKDIKALL
jgi:hypothetical protein